MSSPSVATASTLQGKHGFLFANIEINGGGAPWSGPIINAPEARQIDTKFDDGHAFAGKITAGSVIAPAGCTTPVSVYDETADYGTSSQIRCYLVFEFLN